MLPSPTGFTDSSALHRRISLARNENPPMHLLDKTVDRIHSVSSLPTVAAKILEIVNNDKSTVADLVRVVEGDPALASRVLRTTNSAACGLSKTVESIHKAVGLLGFNQIRNLAVTASVAAIFRSEEMIGAYQRRALWKHLVSTAVVARMIALRLGSNNFEEIFLGGLLHDIGIVLIDQHLHADFVRVIQSLPENKLLSECEREAYGFDHAVLGARVGENWRFPASVVAAIRFHHAPNSAKPDHRLLVQAVAVANFLCTKKGIGSIGARQLPNPDATTLADLTLGRRELLVLWQDIDHELERYKALIEL